MFPASIKAASAFASTYSRGVQLAKKGAVLECDVYELEEKGSCELTGKVRGSSASPYSTWVKLDLKRQKVVDYDCSCPANSNYAGMCKHGVAMALAYLEDHPVSASFSKAKGASKGKTSTDELETVDAVRSAYEQLVATIAAGSSLKGAKGAKSAKSARGATAESAQRRRVQPTSQSIIELMNASAAIAQHEAEMVMRASGTRIHASELADFSCTIARAGDPRTRRSYDGSDDSYELRLRVQCGKTSYVVKRIDELASAWETGDVITYGKNLTLAHTRDAVTERAAALLDLVVRLERAQRALYWSDSRYWYYGNGTSKKSLSLTSGDAIAVLDLMMGASVEFEGMGRYGKQVQKVEVRRGNPHLDFVLEPAPSDFGGWNLRVPAHAACIRSNDDLYVLDGSYAWRCDDDYTRRAGTLLEVLLPAGVEPLHVAEADLPVFCERVLPMLEAQVGFDTPTELAEFVPPEAEFTFRIGLVDGCVTCTASVSYDEAQLPLFADLASGQPVRDMPRELAAQQLVREYFPNGPIATPSYTVAGMGAGVAGVAVRSAREPIGLGMGPGMPWFPEDDVESLCALLTDGVLAFSAMGEVLLADSLNSVNVRQAPEVRVEASVTGGLLDLTVDASGMEPGDLVRYLASYRRKQRFVRLSSGDIMRLGAGVQALSELADGLGVDDGVLLGADGSGGQLPVNRTLFVDALMKDAPGVRFDRDEGFRAIVRAFDTIADSDFVEPASLRGVLRSYQRTGFKWLSTLSAVGFGGILADDMGLGKTLQVIALLLARKEGIGRDAAENPSADTFSPAPAARPSLVVCPASLVYNWLAEIERFAPGLAARAVVGPAYARKRLVAAACEPASGIDVLVTSYDLMKRDIEAYAHAGFDVVVLDEAHYIKNASTQTARAAKRLPSRVRFALTGTPVENRLSELWSIFDFLMPGVLGSRESFAKRFEKPIAAGENDVVARLRSLVSPFILRRLKADVLTDLPEKNESIVYAQMEGEQDKLYKANADRLALELSHQMPEEFAANRIAVLAELTRLRQICCDPRLAYEDFAAGSAKLDTCMELVASAVEAGHSILLFSQFTSMLDLLAERLRKERVGYLMLTGATSKEQRARLVSDFQAHAAPVFLISLKAGGVGLNLTAADIVIHYDPWWNLAAQNQATDRAHRIGQTRDVSVFKLIAKGTIEERIVEMQERKRDLAESVLGGDGVASTALTRDDILALLDS